MRKRKSEARKERAQRANENRATRIPTGTTGQ